MLPAPLKISISPVKKNSILVRIENIGDLFDIAGLNVTLESVNLSLTDLANQFWVHVNNDYSNLATVNIRELTITAN